MKIMLAVIGSHGDVLPFLAIGRELVRRGHEVSIIAPAPFAPHAARVGLSFHPLGTQADYDRSIREPALWHPRRGIKSLIAFATAAADPIFRLIEQHRADAEIVVAAPTVFGARIAQELLHLPTVTLHVIPLLLESRLASPQLPGLAWAAFTPSRFRHWLGRGGDRYVVDPVALPSLNALRASRGLGAVRRLRHWWNSPSRMVLMFPDWYAPPQLDWPLQAVQVGFPMADRLGDAGEIEPELAAFLDAGDPPLVFTYGSGMVQAASFFATAIGICRRMGRRGILLSPQSGQIPANLPSGVVHAAYAPLSLLLPRCAALIHHGGIGTVAQALAAGVPQLVVPVAFNHFDDGERLRRLGVGARLRRSAYSPGRAARELHRLLTSPQVAKACASAQARLRRQDGVGAACDVIERMRSAA